MSESNTTVITRRDLIKILIGSGVSIAAAVALTDPLTPVVEQLGSSLEFGEDLRVGPLTPHWGMVIDLSKCIGCEYCVYACQATNDTTDDMRWNIHIVDQTPTGETFHLTRPCLHCQNAPCVNVCPVGATFHQDDGIVAMDYTKCIGCRYCQAACPYGARSFNWEARNDEPNPYVPDWGTPEVARRPRGVAEKCTFCVHRVAPGFARHLTPGVDAEATPACVNACPVDARHFGNLNDPDSNVSRIVTTLPTIRLREDLGTEPSVYYIPPEGLI